MIPKNKTNFFIVVLVFTAISCQNKQGEINKTDAGSINNFSTSSNITNKAVAKTLWSWSYSMDWRYGRTCGPGGGICFIGDHGDVLDYGYFDVVVSDVPGDDGTDPDAGPMYLRVEDNKLHVIFCRSIEGDKFQVDTDVRFDDKLLSALGKEFTIRKGEYGVNYSTYNEYGEAWLDIY
jgi:hypothetical protein